MIAATLSFILAGLLPALGPAGGPDSPEALANRIQAQVIPASLQKLDELVAGPDTTIALAAAWERVRRTTPATTGPFTGIYTTSPARFNASPGPMKADLARFVGLVRGRLRCPIPKAWKASVESAKYADERVIWFPTIEHFYPMKGLVLRSLGERLVPRRDSDHWIVKARGESLVLPASRFEGPVAYATVRMQGDIAYVALYSSGPGTYTLCAVERSTSRIVWSSQVWTGLFRGFWSGPGDQSVVEMQFADDSLAVFGFSHAVPYVEVFDARTGKNECRFSTSYFPIMK